MFKKKLEHQKKIEKLEKNVQILTGLAIGLPSANDNTKLSIDNKSNGSADKGNSIVVKRKVAGHLFNHTLHEQSTQSLKTFHENLNKKAD